MDPPIEAIITSGKTTLVANTTSEILLNNSKLMQNSNWVIRFKNVQIIKTIEVVASLTKIYYLWKNYKVTLLQPIVLVQYREGDASKIAWDDKVHVLQYQNRELLL